MLNVIGASKVMLMLHSVFINHALHVLKVMGTKFALHTSGMRMDKS